MIGADINVEKYFNVHAYLIVMIEETFLFNVLLIDYVGLLIINKYSSY